MEAQYFLFGRRWRNLYIPNLIKVIAESEKKTHFVSPKNEPQQFDDESLFTASVTDMSKYGS